MICFAPFENAQCPNEWKPAPLADDFNANSPLVECNSGGLNVQCNACEKYVELAKKYGVDGLGQTATKKLSENNEPINLVLSAISENPNLTKEKIAEKIGMSRATVTRAITKLVENGEIQRIGSNKTGHWIINV